MTGLNSEHAFSFAKTCATIVAMITTVVASVASLVALAWLVLPTELFDDAKFKIGNALDLDSLMWATPSYERVSARMDGAKVELWIRECSGAASFDDLPTDIQYLLTDGGVAGDEDEGHVKVGAIETRVARLDYSITDQRKNLDQATRASYFSLQVSTIATIAIGFLTTVLVILSNTEIGKASDPNGKWIRTLAVVFPAVGTAAAAIIAFYGPGATYATTRQALAGLGELQREFSDNLLRFPTCPNKAASNERKVILDKLDQWEDRYTSIVNSLNAPASDHSNDKQKDKETQTTAAKVNASSSGSDRN